MLNFSLSPEQLKLQKKAREFALKEILPLEDLPLHRETDPAGVKPHNKKGKTAWRCRICGHTHYGDEPPDECPYCFFPKTAFKKV